MRTTVDIPDMLYRRLKSRAASQGRTVKSLLLEAAEAGLQTPDAVGRGGRVQLPLIKSRKPGTLKLDNATLDDLIGYP